MTSKRRVFNSFLSFVILFISLAGFAKIQAQDVKLSFPDEVTGEPEEPFSVDVKASDLTDLNIFNFDLEMSFDSSLLDITADGIQDGDLLAGPLTVNVTDDDRILVSYASSQALSASGTLFTVSGTLSPDEGNNPEGLKVIYMLLGDGSLDVAPSVPVDIAVDVAIIEKVALDFGGSISGQVGESFSRDITVSDLTDLGVSNFDMEMSFDSALLSITDDNIQVGDLLDGPLTVNVTEDDRILVSYASSQALSGAGTLFTISGTLAGAGTNTLGIRVTDLLIGDGSLNVTPSVPVDIEVNVDPQPVEEIRLDFGGAITGQVGESFSQDITISDLTDLGVSNFDMEMSFDSSFLTITDEDIQGGDLLGGPLTVNVTDDDRILVSYASSQTLEGAGTLLMISGTLAGPGENAEGLKVTDLLIGDGSLDVTPTVPFDIAVIVDKMPIEWDLSTQLIELTGPDATNKIVDITQRAGTDALSWNLSSNVNWLSFPDGTSGMGSTSVSVAIDENTQPSTREGEITISTNAGSKTVTVIQPGKPGEITLKFGDPIKGLVGESFLQDITVSDLSNLSVSNFDMELSFDASLLSITDEDIQAGSLLAGPLTVNVTDDGRILVSYASSQALEGGGKLFTISGMLAGAGENPEGLKVTDLLIGDGSLNVTPSVPVDISVDVEKVPIEWMLSPQTVELTDALASTVEVMIDQSAGTDALSWNVSTEATWLKLQGSETGTGDATLVYDVSENDSQTKRQAIIEVSTNAGTDQVTVTQPKADPIGEVTLNFGSEITGQVGESFSRDVTISDLTGLGVLNFGIEMSFDSSLLSITDEDIQGGDLLGGPLTVNVTDDDRILMSYASSQSLQGAGTLFTISGTLAGPGANTEGLKVTDLLIGDGSLTVTPSGVINISVKVDDNMPKVVLESPVNGADNIELNTTLTWSPVEQATRYRIDISRDQSHNDRILREPGVSQASYSPEILDNSTTYYWRVQGFNEEAGYGEWSDTWSFKTEADPASGVPIQLLPVDDAKDISLTVTFEWEPVEGADRYELYYYTANPSQNNSETTVKTLQLSFTPIEDLFVDRLYEWRVRAIFGESVGDWSPIWSFRTSKLNMADLQPIINKMKVSTTEGDQYLLNYEYDLKNVGTADSDSFDTDIYLSTDEQFDDDDIFLKRKSESPLSFGSNRTITDNAIIPGDIPAGDYSLIVYVDRENKLEELDESNNVDIYSTVVVSIDGRIDQPFTYSLSQNYPNPFNPSTQINYSVQKQSRVTLEIYTMLGESIAVLVDEIKSPGSYNVSFDASTLSSGTYLYRLQAGDFVKTEKMMLIK